MFCEIEISGNDSFRTRKKNYYYVLINFDKKENTDNLYITIDKRISQKLIFNSTYRQCRCQDCAIGGGG